MVIVPLLSIAHWIWTAYKGITWAGGYNNGMNAWMFSYAAQSLTLILFFFRLYDNTIKPYWEGTKESYEK